MKSIFYILFVLSGLILLNVTAINAQQDTSCVGNQGNVVWSIYSNISGNDLSDMYEDFSYPLSPTYQLNLNAIEITSNFNNDYGTIVKGFIKIPVSGNYIFNVTGNNNARFFLGESTDPNAIATVATTIGSTGQTNHYEDPEQTSDTLSLTGGNYHYFELHHKEGGYSDHATVYWKTPIYADTLWRVVNATYLFEYMCDTSCPVAGTPCDDGDQSTINDMEDGNCNCIGEYDSPNSCIGPRGDAQVMFYDSISGSDINNLYNAAKFPLDPDTAIEVNQLKMPYAFDDNYGTFLRGYLRTPVSGTYHFNITGDDDTRLYISSDETVGGLHLVAEIDGWTGTTNHYKYPTQTSADILFDKNDFYYFELHHKEGGGGDHSTIFWKTPFRPDTNWIVVQGMYVYGYDCELACIPEGTACNDHDPTTENDQYDASCDCIGTPCGGPCDQLDSYITTATCAPQEEYSNNAMDSWLSCQKTENPNTVHDSSHWIMYDFGEPLKIKRTRYWNYNVENETGKGAKTVIIDYSDDQATWTNLGTYQWPEASGLNGFTGDSIPDLNDVITRYLLFTITESWSDTACAGFSEILFDIRRCLDGGTLCDDGDPNTINDIYDNFCNCIGIPLDLENSCDTPILYLTQPTVTTGDYNAEDKVVSTSQISAGNIVTFAGGNSVELNAGFEVLAGALFYAFVEPCLDPITLPPLRPITPQIQLPDKSETANKKEYLDISQASDQVVDIHFQLNRRSPVSLQIRDNEGNLVLTFIANRLLQAGEYSKRLPLKNLDPDIYYVLLQTKNNLHRQRIVVTE